MLQCYTLCLTVSIETIWCPDSHDVTSESVYLHQKHTFLNSRCAFADVTDCCTASHLCITPMEKSGIVELEKSAPIILRLISSAGHVKPTHMNNAKHKSHSL